MYWLFCILEVLRNISYNILWFTSNYRGVYVCLCVCVCVCVCVMFATLSILLVVEEGDAQALLAFCCISCSLA